MIDDNFTIQPYHWLITMCVAIVLHAFLLINYKQEIMHNHEYSNANQNEVIIGLKKLKSLPEIEKPNVLETVVDIPVPVEPSKPKPVIKKQKIHKPKPKPVIKPRQEVIKPTVMSPQVAPLDTIKKQNHTSSLQSVKNPTSRNERNTSADTENIKTHYYAKLSQWLEQHKKYPTIARRRNQQGDVTIQFVTNKKGELLRYQLIKPSEHHSLNTATIEMLERASPMPVPPEKLIGDKSELVYTIPVKFNLVK
jgi:protein TonB